VKALFEQIKPFLPVLYIALGVAIGILGLKSCTKPEPVVVTHTRTVEVPGPSDTVEVVVKVPVRVPYRVEVPMPSNVAPDSVLQDYIVSLWVSLDEKQARIDSLENITATATTETPEGLLTAHLDMPLFLQEPKRGLWAEASFNVTDTTRTNKESCDLTFWRRFGIGIGAGLQYDAVGNKTGAGINAGVQFRIY
jgi:hypothetical protein